MNTRKYYQNGEDYKNEIRIEDDKLALEQFALNDEKNRILKYYFMKSLKP